MGYYESTFEKGHNYDNILIFLRANYVRNLQVSFDGSK